MFSMDTGNVNIDGKKLSIPDGSTREGFGTVVRMLSLPVDIVLLI